MIQRLGPRVETRLDVAKPLPPRQLREHHADQPLASSKVPHLRLGVVALNTTVQRLAMNQIENLRKNVAP